MSMKLYVGNLPPTFDDQQLRELFASYGAIASAKMIIDRETGRPKGFGFVEFENREEAENAMKELDKKMIGKGAIIVNEARPQERREGNSPFKKRFR